MPGAIPAQLIDAPALISEQTLTVDAAKEAPPPSIKR